MSRRRNKGNEGPILILIAAGIVISIVIAVMKELINFVFENSLYLLLILLGVAIIYATYNGIKLYKQQQRIKLYRSTAYYEATKIPYKDVIRNKGLFFEMEVYNKLKTKYPRSKVLINLLIPRVGSINEYSEIDIILLHPNGLFVLELKNYSGYIYGKKDNEYWNVGRNNENGRKVYQFYNPIKQNEQHIKDLKKVISEDFRNYVIFNDSIELDSMIENVLHLDAFFVIIQKLINSYSELDLRNIEEKITEMNVIEKKQQHIERIKFNEVKYSGYRSER